MIARIIVIVLIILANGCYSNPTNVQVSQASSKLEGGWLWKQSSGGIAGQIIIPSENQKVVLKFTSDGRYSQYRNDTLQYSSTYTIKKDKTIYSADSLDVIYFKEYLFEKLVILQLTKDSLELADNFYDGFGFTYIKIQ
jgi:hypothetical protein